MKRRSSKVFAATLALLVCLNAMPFGALAADEGQGDFVVAGWQAEDGNQSEDLTDELAEDLSQDEQLKESDQTEDQAGEQSEDEQLADVDQAEDQVDEQPAQELAEEAQSATEDKLPEEEPEQNQEQFESQQPQTNMVSENVEPASNLLAAPRADETVYYVSKNGSDETGDGTKETPFASLAKAVKTAKDGDTIVLQSDVEAEETARISDKHLTISSEEGQRYTISRAEGFEPISDNNQSWYNGAIIEVTAPNGSGDAASVTLKNVILDDKGRHAGEYFAQTNTSTVSASNADFVQDSMITAHGKSDAAVYITLEDGAELKNFGGMSALYGTTNVHITMKSGSKITDVDVTDRSKSGEGKKDETGPAGAVWLQGAEFNMESGAEITGVVGRAIYADVSAQAMISGTIRNITGDPDMWQGKNGGAIHIRGGSTVTMKDGAAIDNAHDCTSIVRLETNSAHFTMEKGSKIVNGGETAVSIFGTSGWPKETKDDLVANIDGEIAYIVGPWNGGNAININEAYGASCTIGENADIHNNQAWTGAIYMQGSALKLDIWGKIRDNVGTQHNGALWMANNFDDNMSVVMHPGAEITGNMCNSANGSGSAAAVVVSRGTFTMEGGKISGNKSRNGLAGGVAVRKSGVFIMNGGEITNNVTTTWGGGIAYNDAPESKECVILNGGTISGNIAQATATPGADGKTYDVNGFSGGVSNDISIATKQSGSVSQYMQISNQMNIGDPNIHIEKYNVDLTNPQDKYQFGNASGVSVTALTEASADKGYSNKALVSLWCYSGKGSTELEFSNVPNVQDRLPVYAAVVPVDADGDPLTDATVEFYGVTQQNGRFKISFPSTNPNGYAVALVQPQENYGSMAITMPETLDAKQADANGNYELTGSATYTISETLFNVMKLDGIKTPTFAIELDKSAIISADAVTLSSDIFKVENVKFENNTLTVVCGLKDGWETTANKTSTLQWITRLSKGMFQPGDSMNVTGEFNATVPSSTEVTVNVLATPDATLMVAGILIQAADITVYMGGEGNDKGGAVDGEGNIVGSSSLPEPGFFVELPEGVTAQEIKIHEVGGTKTWTLQPYDDKNNSTDREVYKINPAQGQDPLRVQFTNKKGETVVSDEFTVGSAVNQELTMDIYRNAVGAVEARTDTDSYYVTVLPGTLKVRGTTINVAYGDKLSENETAPVGKAAVKIKDNTSFTINGSDVVADSAGVKLLFDDVINTTPTQQDRLVQLAQRADKELGAPAADKVRNFSPKYLDLVDTANGNAWVAASEEVTVCWPYPEGTDKNTEFTVLHFTDLHRDMESGDVSGDIAESDVEIVTAITKTDNHIEFQTKEFSPFALVWYTDKPAEDSKDDNEDNSSSVTPQKNQTSQVVVSTKAPEATSAVVIPQTSDNSKPALWAGLLLFSGAALTALYLLKRRKGNRGQ